MNELTIFEDLRPEVRPLTTAQVDALRAHLFAGTGLPEPETVDIDAWLDDGPDLAPTDRGARPGRRTWLVGIAAAVVAVLGIAGVWAFGRSGADDPPGPARQPDTTPVPEPVPVAAPPPAWYSAIRPFLPDGMDQIALVHAQPEVVSFKAFHSDTRQVLDIVVTLQPGYDAKDTGETPTFTDDAGDYFEGTSGLGLTTTDDRRVSVGCGLSPIAGGAVGSVGMAGSRRDYCGDGFEGLDATARRALAARLATELPTDIVTPAFGRPDPPATETDRTLDAVRGFVGDDRLLDGGVQWGGAVRLMNISAEPTGPTTTELTIVHGVWPPRAADGSPANGLAEPTPRRARFVIHDDLATAFVVADDGTGYSIVTSDTTDAHLDQLGGLLQQLVDPVGEITATTAPPATALSGVTVRTSIPEAGSALVAAMEAEGTVLVVNGSGAAGLGASLTTVLHESGYAVRPPVNSTEPVAESIAYFRDDAPAAAVALLPPAIPVGRAEQLGSQHIPADSSEDVAAADVIVVLGADLANAPWSNAPTPLVTDDRGVLLVLDGASDGRRQTAQVVATLGTQGVDVVDGGTATRPVEASILMPLGAPTRWTFAVADLAGIGGFDTWTPTLFDGAVPADVTAVLVVGP